MKREGVDSWWGWMVVLASAFNRIVIFGVSYSAGVVYVVILEVFREGSGITSWISSLITAVLFFTCPLSGYLIRRFGERKVAIVGSLIASIGMIASAFVNSVPALIFTYGIVSGRPYSVIKDVVAQLCDVLVESHMDFPQVLLLPIQGLPLSFGCGLAFMPGSVAVAKYFRKNRHLALGISSAGGGVGSFAFPPIIEALNERYTWRGMFLILGGVTLNSVVFGALFRPLQENDKADQKSHESGYSSGQSEHQTENRDVDNNIDETKDLETSPLDASNYLHRETSREDGFFSKHFYLKIPSYYILMVNIFMYQFGASIVYGHLQAYAVYEMGFTKANAAILYTVSGVMILIFKLLHGFLGNIENIRIFKPINQYIFSYLIGGIATICLLIKTSHGLYFYSAVFGMSNAACGGSLIPSLLIDLAGVESFGLTYGIILFWLAVGQLAGAPVAGFLYDKQHSYNVSFLLAGTMMVVSALIMIYPRFTDLRPKEARQAEQNVEITVDEVKSIDEEPPTVFDPISVSIVKGSRTSLHRDTGHSLHNLQNPHYHGNQYHSSHGLHQLNIHGDSIESLDIKPRSSSFSVRTRANQSNKTMKLGSPSLSHYHPIISPLALKR